MCARWLAARLIDDSGRNAKSATWRALLDVRCPIHSSDGTIEREHCGTAFLCARKQVCESGSVCGRCGGAGMCHSHVCITGMSLAGVYYIYYVTIYYVNDKTKNEVPLLPLSLSLSRRFCLGT